MRQLPQVAAVAGRWQQVTGQPIAEFVEEPALPGIPATPTRFVASTPEKNAASAAPNRSRSSPAGSRQSSMSTSAHALQAASSGGRMAWTSATKASARAGASAAAMNARNAARAGVEHVGSGSELQPGAPLPLTRTSCGQHIDVPKHGNWTMDPGPGDAGRRAGQLAHQRGSSLRWPHSDDADRGETVAGAPKLTYAARAARWRLASCFRARRRPRHKEGTMEKCAHPACLCMVDKKGEYGSTAAIIARRPATSPSCGADACIRSAAEPQSWRSATIGSTPAARRAGR